MNNLKKLEEIFRKEGYKIFFYEPIFEGDIREMQVQKEMGFYINIEVIIPENGKCRFKMSSFNSDLENFQLQTELQIKTLKLIKEGI